MTHSELTRRIVLDGELDLTRKDEVAALFGSLDGESAVIIDLTKVTYIDSTVLRELAALRLGSARRTITLAGANKHLRHIFEVVSFDRIFDIVD